MFKKYSPDFVKRGEWPFRPLAAQYTLMETGQLAFYMFLNYKSLSNAALLRLCLSVLILVLSFII